MRGGGVVVFGRKVEIGSSLDDHLEALRVALHGRLHEHRATVPVLQRGAHVPAYRLRGIVRGEEEFQDLAMTARGCFARDGPPVPLLEPQVRAVLEQEPQRVHHPRVRRALSLSPFLTKLMTSFLLDLGDIKLGFLS